MAMRLLTTLIHVQVLPKVSADIRPAGPAQDKSHSLMHAAPHMGRCNVGAGIASLRIDFWSCTRAESAIQ